MTTEERIDDALKNSVTILSDIRVTRAAKENQFRDWLRVSIADDKQAADDVLKLLIERGLIPAHPKLSGCGDPNCLPCRLRAAQQNEETAEGDNPDADAENPLPLPFGLRGLLGSLGLQVPGGEEPEAGTAAMTESAAPNPPQVFHFLIGDNLVVVTPANNLQYTLDVTPLTRVC